MPESLVFLPGWKPTHPGLLSRYLPPIREGVATAWLRTHVEPGAWVLDPFGAAPGLTVEAARAGYRVLVAANNPVARFLLELATHPPDEVELRAALAELAAARKGEERLEPHIRSLYRTICAQCEQPVTAQAFLWEPEATEPYARIYECEHCGDSGEKPVTQADIRLAASFATTGMHRARALERIAPPGDPDRGNAEEALNTYLPRAVYAVITVINRLDSLLAEPTVLEPDASRRRNLVALMLSALDQANTLWPHPTGRARPRQLTIQTRFREKNLWLALEEAVEGLASRVPPLPLTIWPEPPPERGGVMVYEGRLKDLREQLHLSAQPTPADINAILAAFPRPNQAYWTLSALWAGWLWGREAIGPFKSVLHRRRYDWAWHTTALEAALSNLTDLLPDGVPLLGLIGEAEPGFLSAAFIAAAHAGFRLDGLALRDESSQAQILWRLGEVAGQPRSDVSLDDLTYQQEITIDAAREHLRQRGEAAHYLSLHAAALSALVEKGAIPSRSQTSPAEQYSQVHQAFDSAFTFRNGFLRFGGSDKSLEVGHWWHRQTGRPETSLADRVELAVVHFLQAHPGCTLADGDTAACGAAPGLLTPDLDLVNTCFESYGEEDPSSSGLWKLRVQDAPATRRADLSAMRKILTDLGVRLGFTPQGEKPLLWLESGNPDPAQPAFIFYVLATATIGELVFISPFPANRCLIVLPGARANLVIFKQRRDPRLHQAIGQGWRFLKFRHLRHLAESPSLTRANLEEMLALDPFTELSEQMRLL